MKARKVSKFLLLLMGLLALCHIALADGVRTIVAEPNRIEPVYLTMGRSTVLRFRDHPRKIVIGNQNYFGVEFIENDVALQPLGIIKTNMFVYTENRTYGFYLIVGQGRSDDLAKIEWQPVETTVKENIRTITPMTKAKKITGINLKLASRLKLTPLVVQYSPDHKMYVLDFIIENISKKEVDLRDMSVIIAKDKVSLSKQILVKGQEELKKNGKSRVRLFFACVDKTDLKVIFRDNRSNQSDFILKRKFL